MEEHSKFIAFMAWEAALENKKNVIDKKPFSSLLLGQWFKYIGINSVYAKIGKNLVAKITSETPSDFQGIYSFCNFDHELDQIVEVIKF